MTDIQYIIETIRPLYIIYRTDGVMKLKPEDNVKVRAIYQQHFGRPMGTCNTCFAEQLLSLILKCEEIEKATIASDEQPKRKKKIEDPFKGIKIDI